MKYSERLKPCPFCGKKAEFRTNTTGTNGLTLDAEIVE